MKITELTQKSHSEQLSEDRNKLDEVVWAPFTALAGGALSYGSLAAQYGANPLKWPKSAWAELGADAALGASIEIPTIDGGKAKIKIPSGTQSGKQFRLKGKGMPLMRNGGVGDLYVQVNTEVPVNLNKEQKELLEKFREIENEKSNPSIKKFFQKAKSFWKN